MKVPNCSCEDRKEKPGSQHECAEAPLRIFVLDVALKVQMQVQLQEAWAAYGVLDDAEAATGRISGWRFIAGEERDVIVGGVEIRVIEDIECIDVKS